MRGLLGRRRPARQRASLSRPMVTASDGASVKIHYSRLRDLLAINLSGHLRFAFGRIPDASRFLPRIRDRSMMNNHENQRAIPICNCRAS